ncbi:protein kinase [Novymonas esmeraldas]|uniref:Protein kinase n=1 Tax=Novymonas esmeraldas TaxID=1808958 RepID=A0AAW0EXA4_9TRYP
MSFESEYEESREPAISIAGRAQVRRCTHRSTGAMRVVKTYDTTTMDRRRADMAAQEGALATALPAAPQLVRVFDVYVSASRVSIVMEHIDGGSLYQRLATRGAVAEAAARAITRHLLTGLAVLHASGVMHRDIKPENLLLRSSSSSNNIISNSDDGDVVVAIADFGFATRRIPSDEVVGSPQYAAPEVALIALQQQQQHHHHSGAGGARPLYSEKCDVWSAGVVVFVLLTGLLPFDGATPTDVFTTVVRNTPPLAATLRRGGVSAAALSFLQQLLTSHPSKRPSAAEALRHPWLTGRSAW